ncbi:hypothetical protein HN51_044171 [Arachis hypogaea]|uniref:AAA+ ATPase domain-containing protein n=1 Tax=Arachis hypogaea TaxID=3818 RepID=A0A444Y3M6_ARAHY|nr:AAA-ATPase At3g50940-like [Arachis ipaensis]XP_025672820.1 AAA-ATPase At3g50940-like [Arachis hypogaea]QHN96349.1 AAA-ATPase [Arachis hypogaea]RYQ96561.1 hypothetical protein Ahy_B08g092351 [Arachis hypogaea]
MSNNTNSTVIVSAVASAAASAMLIRSAANELVPSEVLEYFSSKFFNLRHHFSSRFTIAIEEYQGMMCNHMYEAAEVYLGTKAALARHRVRASKSGNDKSPAFSIDKDEEILDDFEGVKVTWRFFRYFEQRTNRNHYINDFNGSSKREVKSYELSFHKKHKDKIFNSYLPFVLERAKAIEEANMALNLYTVGSENEWIGGVEFAHPMSFKTLAIDADLKNKITDDLDKFVKGKEFYNRTGKAWKRGYLLYGPPGTGKSSLIAAMANYLNYDLYDLDLSAVPTNRELKNLVLNMSNRSILVMEDIDCTIKLQNREEEEEEDNMERDKKESKVTLSGLLNAIDGLWSCCGEERIIVFTTNHKEKLDPALLRPGRMDMHIHLSYCTFSAFKQLACNYLKISDHNLFQEIEGLLREVQVTPAEIAGELQKKINAENCLPDIVKFLHNKKMVEQNEPKLSVIME